MKCIECDGTGEWFDPSHSANRICKTCKGTGNIEIDVEHVKVMNNLPKVKIWCSAYAAGTESYHHSRMVEWHDDDHSGTPYVLASDYNETLRELDKCNDRIHKLVTGLHATQELYCEMRKQRDDLAKQLEDKRSHADHLKG